MNPLDIALIVVAAVPAVIGLFKGLVNLGVAFLGTWLGFVVARLFHRSVAGPVEDWLGNRALADTLAYAGLFFATLVAAGIAGYLVSRSLKQVGLQWANRLAGAGLGLAVGLLLGGLLVAAMRTALPESEALRTSALAEPIGKVTSFVIGLRPTEPAAPAPATQPASS